MVSHCYSGACLYLKLLKSVDVRCLEPHVKGQINERLHELQGQSNDEQIKEVIMDIAVKAIKKRGLHANKKKKSMFSKHVHFGSTFNIAHQTNLRKLRT